MNNQLKPMFPPFEPDPNIYWNLDLKEDEISYSFLLKEKGTINSNHSFKFTLDQLFLFAPNAVRMIHQKEKETKYIIEVPDELQNRIDDLQEALKQIQQLFTQKQLTVITINEENSEIYRFLGETLDNQILCDLSRINIQQKKKEHEFRLSFKSINNVNSKIVNITVFFIAKETNKTIMNCKYNKKFLSCITPKFIPLFLQKQCSSHEYNLIIPQEILHCVKAFLDLTLGYSMDFNDFSFSQLYLAIDFLEFQSAQDFFNDTLPKPKNFDEAVQIIDFQDSFLIDNIFKEAYQIIQKKGFTLQKKYLFQSSPDLLFKSISNKKLLMLDPTYLFELILQVSQDNAEYYSLLDKIDLQNVNPKNLKEQDFVSLLQNHYFPKLLQNHYSPVLDFFLNFFSHTSGASDVFSTLSDFILEKEKSIFHKKLDDKIEEVKVKVSEKECQFFSMIEKENALQKETEIFQSEIDYIQQQLEKLNPQQNQLSTPSDNSDQQKDATPSDNSDQQKDATPSDNSDQQKDATPSDNSDQQKDATPSDNSDQQKDATPSDNSNQQNEIEELTQKITQLESQLASNKEEYQNILIQKEAEETLLMKAKEELDETQQSVEKERSSLNLLEIVPNHIDDYFLIFPSSTIENEKYKEIISSTSGSFNTSLISNTSIFFLFLKNSFCVTQITLIFSQEPQTFTLKGSNDLVNWSEIYSKKDKIMLYQKGGVINCSFPYSQKFQFFWLDNICRFEEDKENLILQKFTMQKLNNWCDSIFGQLKYNCLKKEEEPEIVKLPSTKSDKFAIRWKINRFIRPYFCHFTCLNVIKEETPISWTFSGSKNGSEYDDIFKQQNFKNDAANRKFCFYFQNFQKSQPKLKNFEEQIPPEEFKIFQLSCNVDDIGFQKKYFNDFDLTGLEI
jgi:hypothetical protein